MNVLRTMVVLLALALMASGGRLLIEGLHVPGFYLLVPGVVLFVATLFERWRYRATASHAAASWQRTGERFVDPESGKTLAVFYDPASGERHYVSDERAGGQPGS